MRQYLDNPNDPFCGITPQREASNRHGAIFSLIDTLGLNNGNVGGTSQSSMSVIDGSNQDGGLASSPTTLVGTGEGCNAADNNGDSSHGGMSL